MAFRDPYGIRPLCLGSRTINGVTDYMMASESVALQSFECKPNDIRDILPGQAVIIEKGHEPQYRQVQPASAYSPDMFEYVSPHASPLPTWLLRRDTRFILPAPIQL